MENCLCSGSGFGDGTGPERGGGWGRRPASNWLIIWDVGRIYGGSVNPQALFGGLLVVLLAAPWAGAGG